MTGWPVDSDTADANTAALPTLLAAVCLGIERRRLLRHLGRAALFGAGVLGVQGLTHALYPAWNWPQALLLAGGLALALLALLEGHAERVTPAQAARLTDRRLGLDDLLGTALSVPPPQAQEGQAGTTGRPAELAVAMWSRLQSRAEQAARRIRPEQVFKERVSSSRSQAGRWPLPVAPLLLAPAALLLWLLPPLTLPRPAVAQAGAVPVQQTRPSPSASPSADVDAAVQVQVRAATTPAPAQTAPPSSNAASSTQGPTLDGASTSRAAGAAAAGGKAPTQAFMRESRSALQATGGAATEATGDPGSVQNSPFGSRESGSLVNEQLPDNPKALAAAPYDPGSKGSGVVKQKKSSGPTGLRAASGGRGVESDGDDRCVQGCLTNNDMNRGNQTPTAAKPKPPGGSTRSGTSSSGGGAAGNSSTVGLGTAQAREVSVTLRRQLLGGVTLNADRVQVLAAPDIPARTGQTGAAAQSGRWTRQPERLTPTDAVSAEARSAVQTYFRRTP